jgi:hypothetical protein
MFLRDEREQMCGSERRLHGACGEMIPTVLAKSKYYAK